MLPMSLLCITWEALSNLRPGLNISLGYLWLAQQENLPRAPPAIRVLPQASSCHSISAEAWELCSDANPFLSLTTDHGNRMKASV